MNDSTIRRTSVQMKVLALLTCVALTGCAGTIEQNRSRPARATYTSLATEPALEHCLSGKLSWTGTPAIIHGDASTEIAFTTDYGTEPLITLRPLEQGTQVEVRLKHRYLSKMRRDIEGCVSNAGTS
ncbi:MAG: hypothetical protein ACR652_17785 [Methylocystis sp.]|uniref:hypothetical protein n=1 Tax=Methylocystis sp. TaxID=1911079 RepID=UPI003DA5049E